MREGLRRAVWALTVAAVLTSSPVRGEAIRIETRDGTRTAILVPARPDPVPTIIVLHGAAIGAEWTMRGSGFAEAAAAHGFAAVFPDGLYRVWNDGREGGRISRIDDVGFLRQLVAWLIGHGVADPAQVYLAGMSNGGMMTLRMLCEAAELFAGAGTLIANMPAGIGDGCRPKKPLPIVMLNGTADPLVLWGWRRGICWQAGHCLVGRTHGGVLGRSQRLRRSSDAPTGDRRAWRGGKGCAAGLVFVQFRAPGHALSRRGRWAPGVRPHRHFCRHPRARHAAYLRARGDAGAFRRNRPLGPIGRAVPPLRTPRQERVTCHACSADTLLGPDKWQMLARDGAVSARGIRRR